MRKRKEDIFIIILKIRGFEQKYHKEYSRLGTENCQKKIEFIHLLGCLLLLFCLFCCFFFFQTPSFYIFVFQNLFLVPYSPIIKCLSVLICCLVIPSSFHIHSAVIWGVEEVSTHTCVWQFFLLLFAILEPEIQFCIELLDPLNLFTTCFWVKFL